MTTNWKALCAEPLAQEAYVAFVQICKGGSDDAGTYDADEAIVRRALKRLHELESAALAEADEPAVPEGREPASVTKQPSDAEQVLRLAAIIREVDGNHSKGAAALAESILDHPGFRVVLASWGTSNLTQTWRSPADGEVAELVAWLREQLHVCLQAPWTPGIKHFGRAAELLERQALVPVSVSERLPGASVKVLAHYFNGLGKERTICAIWVPAKTRSDSYGDDDFTEYDEESDTFYWPEGWYETIENWDDLGYVKVVEGEVIYWQPIPTWPAHALPLPEVGE